MDDKIEELEKENIQFAKWVQINASEAGEQRVRAEKAEARIKELEEEIESILGESTISYVVEKRLKELIEKGKRKMK